MTENLKLLGIPLSFKIYNDIKYIGKESFYV